MKLVVTGAAGYIGGTDALGWQPKHPELDDIVVSAWRLHQHRFGSASPN